MNRETVEQSLIRQLKLMGADIDVFLDLVEKYMQFWDIDEMLTADIKNRGVTFTDKSAAGVAMMKNNPSVKERVMVVKQMQAILKDLNLSTDKVGDFEDEEM